MGAVSRGAIATAEGSNVARMQSARMADREPANRISQRKALASVAIGIDIRV